MIINPEVITDKYSCGKIMAKYLIFKKGIPLLAMFNNTYYFALTPELKSALKDAPFWFKMLKNV